MKFDLIVSNPPFEDSKKRKKTPHKLWIDFTHKEFSLLKEGGELAQISPSSFLSPSSRILPYFTNYWTKNLNLDTSNFFNVGSTFADYNIIKTKLSIPKPTSVIENSGNKCSLNFSKNTYYLPNDLCSIAVEIHNKVMFNNLKKMKVLFDYVTCHNILLKVNPSTLSKIQTPIHSHPVFHTNPQIWFSSVKQDFSNKKKVMWTRSGYTLPFYDDGKYGCTDMGYYVLVGSDIEGHNLVNNLNTSLFKYILSTARWSGFGNELIFKNLPELPVNKSLSDSAMFQLFGITQKEQDYIYHYFISKKTKNKNKNTNGGKIRDIDRVKVTAEVFTSDELANRLVSQIDVVNFTDPSKKILEPSGGNGQLVLAVLRKMKDLGRNDWKHIINNQLYVCDLMKDNVNEMIHRISDFTGLYVDQMNHNIVCADALRYHYRFDGTDPYETEDDQIFNNLFDVI
jgi:hypothetical protein